MSDRKRRLEIAKSLKELLQSKGKAPSVKYQQTFEELKEASDLVSKELTTIDWCSFKPICIFFKSVAIAPWGSYYRIMTSRTISGIEKYQDE